jgi:hypothetical protein
VQLARAAGLGGEQDPFAFANTAEASGETALASPPAIVRKRAASPLASVERAKLRRRAAAGGEPAAQQLPATPLALLPAEGLIDPKTARGRRAAPSKEQQPVAAKRALLKRRAALASPATRPEPTAARSVFDFLDS